MARWAVMPISLRRPRREPDLPGVQGTVRDVSDAIDIEHALEGVQLRSLGRLRGAQRGQLIDPPSKLVDVAGQLCKSTSDRIELTLQCVERSVW